jgi:V/A-type H+-transporting ATPase subunit K
MISKNKLAKMVFGSAFLVAMGAPTMAVAMAAAPTGAPADWRTSAAKAMAAAFTMAISAWSAGYAQSKIGAAAAGTLAERPEAGGSLLVLQALPEIIVLLGFVIAFMINS